MKPTETLRHEHQIVSAVLTGAEREAQNIQSTGEVDSAKIEQILEFFRVFVDKCHHAKEEKLLFPRLQERGMSGQVGPISIMLREHNEGRQEIAAISDALARHKSGDASAAADIAYHLLAYVELLQDHIMKEDNVLFNFADDMLTDEDEKELAEKFDELEAKEIGEGVHEEYHQFAHEIMKK
jgi:hemerythrin-like domain-containing protein